MTTILVDAGDVLDFECDALVLKYAQARYGADGAVARALIANGEGHAAISPAPRNYSLVASRGAVVAPFVMFVGVNALQNFGYLEIRVFARDSLAHLAERLPDVRTIACTMHGAGYGLDEREAFESMVAGFVDAIRSTGAPQGLSRIIVVDRDPRRVRRLAQYLTNILPDPVSVNIPSPSNASPAMQERLKEAGYFSKSKPHVFVAMPFNASKTDHYHYGIQSAVNTAGYLCERIDLTSFTGDILAQMKQRISTAKLVIADLSGGNPNVYLEVGYAWGRGIPTVLLVDDAEDLKFDVQGQRCLAYGSIRELETKLTAELRELG